MSGSQVFFKTNDIIIQSLKNITIPINSINDLTGRDTQSLAIFSDYGPEKGKYRTFGYYLTDWNCSGTLISSLRKIKEKYGILERSFSFKSRKDQLKQRAFKDWFEVVKNYPGLLYILAFDNEIKQTKEYQSEMKKIKESLNNFGIKGGVEAVEKMALALSFFVIIAPYLKDNHNVAWISDPDTIIDTIDKQILLNNSFGFLVEELIEKKIGSLSFLTKFSELGEDPKIVEGNKEFNKIFEELLSIPDIACSAFASSLDISHNKELLCVDDEAAEIIKELGDLPDISHFVSKHFGCSIGISKFKLDYDKGEPFYRHFKVFLKNKK